MGRLRVLFRVAGAAALVSAGLLMAGPGVAFASADPDNRGHHYGQLKHHHVQPTPAPAPTPAPVSTPTPQPKPVSPARGSGSALSVPRTTDVAAVKPAAPVTTTAPPIRVAAKAVPSPSGRDLGWLLLLVLPALLAICVVCTRGIAIGLAKALHTPQMASPATAAAPQT